MTTKEIASLLVEMCRNGQVEEAKEKLFAEDITSTEPVEGFLPKQVKGMEAIRKKAELFISMVDNFYGSTLSDPIIAGDYFSVSWETDIQMKGEARKTMGELCVYKTNGGKIISADSCFFGKVLSCFASAGTNIPPRCLLTLEQLASWFEPLAT